MEHHDLEVSHISDQLLAYLRHELNNPAITYRSPMTPLQGGYETAIYRFRLNGVGEELSQFLVLRLYPPAFGAPNVIWEQTVQNALSEAGYPAAKVHFTCMDPSWLGAAFLIMDYITGQPLIFAGPNTAIKLMGKAHAELHEIDPALVTRRLHENGFNPYVYSLDARMNRLKGAAEKMAWARDGVDWLLAHRPPEPEHVTVCHGDFHAINIMADHGEVTGVLDWAGLAVTDPAYDIGNTLLLTTIPVKHLSASWEGYAGIDWDQAAEVYCAEYQRTRPLDRTNLDYYRVRRCLQALIEGYEGQKVWQHPMIVRDLIDYFYKVTHVLISLPGQAKEER